jgi:hypothetical protein
MMQNTSKILMIEPVAFGYNAETAVNNFFQSKGSVSSTDVQANALAEFNNMVSLLRNKGVDVMVVKDTPEPHTPDSVFPNNWISFHDDGRVVLYPMFAENRRLERRMDVVTSIAQKTGCQPKIIDYSIYEKNGRFLEGTGSMILDRSNKIAYAAISQRTDPALFLEFCKDFGYEPVSFSAFQQVGAKRLPVYHTNVMMCVADSYVVICTDCIDDKKEQIRVMKSILESGKEIIEISEKQMQHFAGNMLQVINADGKKLLVMSQTAFNSLPTDKIEKLRTYNELLVVNVPTIEKLGGGSVRCMMCEVF